MRKLNRSLLAATVLATSISLFGVSCGDAAAPDGSGGEPSTGGGGGGDVCWECPWGCAAGCLDPAFDSCGEMMAALCGPGGAGGDGGQGGIGGLGGIGGDEN